MNILLDTNVVLDVLLAREPFVHDAKEIFILIENNKLQGYLCATSITTLHYLIGREKNKQDANKIIENILKLFDVTQVDKNTLLLACASNGTDYEDSVIYSSCKNQHIDHIITRDKKGFKNSTISTLAPKEFLALWDTDISYTQQTN